MEVMAISNSPQFQGRVDKSVIKFVNNCVKDACEAEVKSASNAREIINKDTIKEIQQQGKTLLKGFEDIMAITHKKSILSIEKDKWGKNRKHLNITNSQMMSYSKTIKVKEISLNSTPKGLLSQLSSALLEMKQNGQSHNYYDTSILNTFLRNLNENIAYPKKFNRTLKKTQKFMKEINAGEESVKNFNNILEKFDKSKEIARQVNSFEKENKRIMKKILAGRKVDY